MSLPRGYKLLEYIQSTGAQKIDTLVDVPANKAISLRVVCDCSFNNVGVGNGVGTTISGNIFYFGTYNGTYCYGLGTIDGLTGVAADTKRRIYDLDAPGKKFTVSDKLSLTGLSFATPTASRTFLLPQWGSGIILYSCQIYDNGTMIRDFIPCQKPDGTIGLWDDVNSVFYGNAGTGTFTAGPVVAVIPDAPSNLQQTMSVRLIWAEVSGAEWYNIYRDGTLLGTTTGLFYVDDTAAENTEYTYGVSAVNSAGESPKTTIPVYTKTGYFLYKPYVESATFQ